MHQQLQMQMCKCRCANAKANGNVRMRKGIRANANGIANANVQYNCNCKCNCYCHCKCIGDWKWNVNGNMIVNLIAGANINVMLMQMQCQILSFQTIAVSKNWLTVTVEDDGKGIKGIAVENVTTRFVKGKNSPGSGLGLSLAKQQAESHGGRLIITSVINKGTKTIVSLPIITG